MVHGFDIKFEIFPSYYFWQNQKENVFDNILERKKLYYTIKHKRLKNPKIGIFPKRLLYGFGQKFENFPSFLLSAKSASKMCLTIF